MDYEEVGLACMSAADTWIASLVLLLNEELRLDKMLQFRGVHSKLVVAWHQMIINKASYIL